MKYLKGLVLALLALSSVNSLEIKASVGDEIECMVCNVLVNEAVAYVEANQTETEIASALSQNCQLLPGFQSICVGIVNQYTPTIVSYILSKESASAICTQIDCCGGSSDSSSSDNSWYSSSSENSQDSWSEYNSSSSENSQDSWSEYNSSSENSQDSWSEYNPSSENSNDRSSSENSQSITGASSGTSGMNII
ncbi:hypothetical protein RB653_000179 [Dictyostelium firmibasis]|uniref:Saposin B-type domain-containing protein n=1 Tax=Dictyostelium firmibasis TaxID=79012 RepID=A0AAN7U2T3_9MYCE